MRDGARRRFSEDDVVALIARRFARRSPLVELGIGDDAAVLRHPGRDRRWIVTTDMLVEGVDFRRDWTSPFELGHKSLAVNLSDLAAMGAAPAIYTVALALPRGVTLRWIREFFRGASELGRRNGAELVGGDLSSSPEGINIAITAIGTASANRILLRSGGQPGDFLYVTGVLGRSAAGLRLLARGRPRRLKVAEREALVAHRTPEPRCESGLWLAQSGLARCMIDLSDGLSMDLPRICKPGGIGAELYTSAIPIFAASAEWGCDPLDNALHGGEDFELLFAVSPGVAGTLERRYPARLPPLSRIGRLTARPAVSWSSHPGGRTSALPPKGYDHFSPHRGRG